MLKKVFAELVIKLILEKKMLRKTPYQLNLSLSLKNPYREKPKQGWEDQTWYILEVAFSNNNPIYRAVFYSGFISKSVPCGYNKIVCTEDKLTYHDTVYLKVIEKLFSSKEKNL